MTCDDSLRDHMFIQTASLVSIVAQYIRNYLDRLMDVIIKHVTNPRLMSSVLILVEELVIAVKDEFKRRLPGLAPLLLECLRSDRSVNGELSLRVLKCIRVICQYGSLEDYLYCLIPDLVSLLLCSSDHCLSLIIP